ncbi:hypothetical protein M501DRAFT_997534 [Patellaria atrata CBS 101060]|uniref:Anaphase-promoting complex subunit 1 n=1 Tax=Patellaria atrata CBS 101060 TaxID=1346257 RepID=A0A9P4S480_9PEZI|nr:hypothetical protein M501DRAFT_997534 [Patellaria atrata CBS 101060]
MASIHSLGVHVPAAVAYLVAESILPEDHTPEQYTWKTYNHNGEDDIAEEEVVATDYCVVWSRGGVVRKVFRFDIEGQKVQQAVLTWFSLDDRSRKGGQSVVTFSQNTLLQNGPNGPEKGIAGSQASDKQSTQKRSRTLVVFLKFQAHVFDLSGSTYVVNLPFEVEKAFPAPRGLILQRKLPESENIPPTPVIPSAPHNSFFSSQLFNQSQSQPRYRMKGSFDARSSKGHRRTSITGLFLEDIKSTVSTPNDALPRLFSFTDPLAEMGLVVCGPSAPGLSSSLSGSTSNSRRLEAIDKNEELLYVSANDEKAVVQANHDRPLIVIVTVNHQTGMYNIWHASYILSEPVSGHQNVGASVGNRTRRRSSYGPATGVTTPSVRNRERESFGGAGARSKTVPASFASQASQSRKTSGSQATQTAEDVLASQLDPDFDMARGPAKESRRVSSLLSRADLSTSYDRSAFQDLATHQTSFGGSLGLQGRRGHSFGTQGDRTSFGAGFQRRIRESTPGSFSRLSLGGASVDETMEDSLLLEDEGLIGDDIIEDYNDIKCHGFHEPLDGLKKELVVVKICEIPVSDHNTAPVRIFQAGADTITQRDDAHVFTLISPQSRADGDRSRHLMFVHIVNRDSREHIEICLRVRRCRLLSKVHPSLSLPKGASVKYALVPSFQDLKRHQDRLDALKVSDGNVSKIVYLCEDAQGKSVVSFPAGWMLSPFSRFTIRQLKLFNPYSLTSVSISTRKSTGLRRILSVPSNLSHLVHPDARGAFDVADSGGRLHRLQVQLSPHDEFVMQCLEVCRLVMPTKDGDFLLSLWWIALDKLKEKDVQFLEWQAFVVTLFSMIIEFVSTKPNQLTDAAQSSGVKPGRTGPKKLAPANTKFTAWDIMWARGSPTCIPHKSYSSPWNWTEHSLAARRKSIATPRSRRTAVTSEDLTQLTRKSYFIPECIEAAKGLLSTTQGQAILKEWKDATRGFRATVKGPHILLPRMILALHLLREEYKLDRTCRNSNCYSARNLAPVLAQLGHWFQWEFWTWRTGEYYALDGGGIDIWVFENSTLGGIQVLSPPWEKPPSVFEWIEKTFLSEIYHPYPTLDQLIPDGTTSQKSDGLPRGDATTYVSNLTPRSAAISKYFARQSTSQASPTTCVELMADCGITNVMLETFPQSIKAPFREAIVRCQASPPTTWNSKLLRLVGRDDLDIAATQNKEMLPDVSSTSSGNFAGLRDIHSICQSSEHPDPLSSTPEADRFSITRLIFSEDRRFMEAARLLEPLRPAVAECIPDRTWSDTDYLEHQRRLMDWVMIRTYSLPSGQSMLYFDSRRPLLTEKFPLHGFSLSCVMKPMNNTVTADRNNFTEERVAWAFFHAGVSHGLSISRHAEGIDTSWIVFNKPGDLTHKHAGLLLALGLNGHLRSIAKWLSFKYLTPKHTFTSIALLLGLSASYLGTMDMLVTRLLSVHVTRLLPPGAAELNLSPMTQTTGLMGIGLLYYNTQHRRMSEVMLSEIEHIDYEDPADSLDDLRDEGYRLAAGFALGFINLGKGSDLRGLHDMHIIERLLSVAVGPKAVDLVHVLDQATAGATIAIALIFMKTHNEAVARKIDIPDTLPQFDYVRPDIFLLRTLAKHLILWNSIQADHEWIVKNLPTGYRDQCTLSRIKALRSEHLPFYNIIAGLLWSVGLRFAGSGDTAVRDFLVQYLDQFIRLCHLPAQRYDAKLTRNTVRNCQDLVALSASTVMAGTGDIEIFRRLRLLHGRINPETPYGSHFAAHVALGLLFLGAGSYTIGTSDLAVAALVCAFYPIFPTDINDNKAHLQAFRHFWVLATEPRCIIARDVDTHRAVALSVLVTLKDGTEKPATAPCLLPSLDTIARIKTVGPEYWQVTLDFENNPEHVASFKWNQTIHVRRRPPHDAHRDTFSATLVALNDAQSSHAARIMWDWIFALPAFREFERADLGLILPSDAGSRMLLDMRTTVVDERLALKRAVTSWDRDALWDLRALFAWAKGWKRRGDGRLRWLGKEVEEKLGARIGDRGRSIQGDS